MKRESAERVGALRAVRRDFQISDRHRRAWAPPCPQQREEEWRGLAHLEAGTTEVSSISREELTLQTPFLTPTRLGWERWGDSWLEEDLAALSSGPDPGEQTSLERSVRGEACLGRGRTDEGEGRPTCVVHHTRLTLLGECPSCKET